MTESPLPVAQANRTSRWRPLRKFFQDLVPVVAGILIALAVDEWAQDRREQAQLRRILQGITRDYTAIERETRKLVPKHKRLVDALYESRQNDSVSAIGVIQQQGGIQFPSIRRPSDLELLGPEGRKHLPYELMANLGKLEQAFRELSEREQTLQQLAYNPRTLERGPQARYSKLSLAILMGDQYGTEDSLVVRLDEYQRLVAPYVTAADTVPGK